ncbi:MAG: hypothetical protein WD063_02495 [Pirellulales bacterium]
MAVRLREFAFRGQSVVRPVFIETGTYQGETLANALAAGFEELHSIEVCASNYELAKARFTDHAQVHLHFGSSPEILPRIIDPAIPTTFWLDAHYQGSSRAEQDPAYGECPLLAELGIIFSHDWSPIVLIDDAYMFDERMRGGFQRSQWPSVEQIRAALPLAYELSEEDEILVCVER